MPDPGPDRTNNNAEPLRRPDSPDVGNEARHEPPQALPGMVAARPHRASLPNRILCYETLSETNWNAPLLSPTFAPNVFVDIAAQLECKLEAMGLYDSQRRDFPHERSLATFRALATLRGSTVHRPAAEAFMLVRQGDLSDRKLGTR